MFTTTAIDVFNHLYRCLCPRKSLEPLYRTGEIEKANVYVVSLLNNNKGKDFPVDGIAVQTIRELAS
jgi:hypothetical protein